MKVTLLAAIVVALGVPMLALASDTPSPAVAACKAEYQQLGQAAFASKYGAGEAGYRACVQAHGGTVPSQGDKKPDYAAGIASALCQAELKQSGADAFAAKYGSGDAGKHACQQAQAAQAQAILSRCASSDTKALEACIKQALGIPAGGGDNPSGGDDAAARVAQALCYAEAKALGKDAFQAKYGTGKDGLVGCVHAAAAKAQSIVAACKAAGTGGEAFKQCVLAALKPGAH
jgi:hypothetical protein